MKENLTKKLKKKKGFTLIELIIVIAILAIIAVIAIPKFGQVQKNAKISSDKANAKTLANAISKEITDDKIKYTGTGAITKIDFNSADSATNPVTQVKNSIQSVPTPKYYKDSHFEAELDTNGNVTVYVNGGTDITEKTSGVTKDKGVEIYPEPAGDYK